MPDDIRVCLVGGGRVAKVHAHSLTHHIPTATITGLVEPIRDVLNTVGDQFSIARRLETFEAALEWGEFDAVVITTPTFTHRALAVMAAEAGKHVFLEKPMAITLSAMPNRSCLSIDFEIARKSGPHSSGPVGTSPFP